MGRSAPITQFTDSEVFVLSPCFPAINLCDILQIRIIERELANKNESTTKKQKW